MSRPSRGFTLVELLVVIVIIGLLVALLLPAILSSREAARQVTCMNNMKEIGLAILGYEAEKGRLPGYINPPLFVPAPPASPTPVSWPMAILPYLGRKDVADTARANQKWTTLRISSFVCPNDPQKDLIVSNLSYVVPTGVASGGVPIYFVDRHAATGTGGPQALSSQVVNPAQSIMIGERSLPDTDPKNPNGVLHAGDPSNGWICADRTRLAFDCPALQTGAQVPSFTVSPAYLTSSHPSIVILCFFDGHGEKLPSETWMKNASPLDLTTTPTDGSPLLQ